jgi:dTDP-4-amino-4,6-dideoxygalactose transaminase
MSPDSETIPFFRPSFDKDEEAAALRVIRSGWLTTGSECLAFEREFSAFAGGGEAVAVCSATAGLHLALEAIGIGRGDLVALPTYTFAATAEVVRYLGAEVVFVDSLPDSPNIDPDCFERLAMRERRIKALIAVHIAGEPCDMPSLLGICDRHGITLIEDAAHAFPSRSPWGFLGRLGRVGVYSFYATKTITTGEGGMVCTDDRRLAARMRLMRLHGIDRDVFDRYTKHGASYRYELTEAGFKYNMTDLTAAIGRAQLTKADFFLSARRKLADAYRDALSGIEGIAVPRDREGHSWHLFQIGVSDPLPPRDELVAGLARRGVSTSVHFIPLHTMPYYARRYGLRREDFPRALARFEGSVSLPLYPSMGIAAVERVSDAIRGLSRLRKSPS